MPGLRNVSVSVDRIRVSNDIAVFVVVGFFCLGSIPGFSLFPVTCQGHGGEADLGTLLGGLLILVSFITVVSALSSLLTAEYRVPVTSRQSHPHMISVEKYASNNMVLATQERQNKKPPTHPCYPCI